MTSTPNLHDFDRLVLNSSAGKDSQAMLTKMVELADAQGYSRDRIVVVHCDLGRVEWQGTAELAETQADFYGLRFVKVARPQGDLLTQIEARGMFPSSTARYCTSDQKTGQVAKVLTALANEVKAEMKASGTMFPRPVAILNCLGLRAEESPARAKKPVWSIEKKTTNGQKTVTRWLPIFEMTTTEVWETIEASGVPSHWAYKAGMPRLSCCFCVLASKSSLVRSAQLNPALAAEYAAVEVRIGHIFRGKPGTKDALSMAEVIEAAQAATAPVEAADWNA